MKTTMALTLAAALAMSCGGTADPSTNGTNGTTATGGNLPTSAIARGEQSGSRLKKVWHAANDNSVTPAGYYDTALKTRCQFTQVAGATELCMPEDVYTLTYRDWNNLYASNNRALFTDSACKSSNVAALDSSSCSKYGIVRVLPDTTSTYVQACGGAQAVAYYLATPLSPGTQLYYYGIPAGGGQCCSCQPLKEWPTGSTLVKMEPLSYSNADQTPLVRAELSVDP
jgi:hypothetical protein